MTSRAAKPASRRSPATFSYIACMKGSASGVVASSGRPLGLAVAAFIGFEATAIYREEARDLDRTVPRAGDGAPPRVGRAPWRGDCCSSGAAAGRGGSTPWACSDSGCRLKISVSTLRGLPLPHRGVRAGRW